jgi:succinate dehydrogenase / fumarate reductase cytochrome b subunit
MSAVALHSRLGRTVSFYQTTLGKKVVMAVTGALMFGFLVVHCAGNLQIFEGAEKMDDYAVTLRKLGVLLWVARLALLVSVILHIVASIQLTQLRSEARPVAYVKKEDVQASYASRTMMWSGPIIFAFIVYHLLHFTFGTVHPDFQELRPYENVVAGFQVPIVSIAYIIAMVMLGFHLYHGLWSMFQTLGVSHPRYTPMLKSAAAIVTALLIAGFVSVPIAVMTGIVS